ncbi:phasin family protein [Roseomonas sp. NAR14]|uniref:Phasin family protein n=1 Tax=Roseomonas acroporae TaxID=2937791 RepID=A0A9X2BVJ6_9PROT|nr:phasin family protein [Roseomonas acroporae]MCK8785096.1 phasin family protein [Roseomonas acroporae]
MAIQPVEAKKTAEDIRAAASAAVNNASATAAAGQESVRKFFSESQNQARVAMEKGSAQASKAAEKMFSAYGEVVEFGRGNVEAMTKSAQTLATGMQDLGKQYFALAQSLTDQGVESAKTLATVRSLKEAADIQSTYARTAIEKVVSESAKLQESAFKLAEAVAAPLAQRVTLAFEKMSRPMAA